MLYAVSVSFTHKPDARFFYTNEEDARAAFDAYRRDPQTTSVAIEEDDGDAFGAMMGGNE